MGETSSDKGYAAKGRCWPCVTLPVGTNEAYRVDIACWPFYTSQRSADGRKLLTRLGTHFCHSLPGWFWKSSSGSPRKRTACEIWGLLISPFAKHRLEARDGNNYEVTHAILTIEGDISTRKLWLRSEFLQEIQKRTVGMSAHLNLVEKGRKCI